MEKQSKPGRLSKADLANIMKVFTWSFGSALVAGLSYWIASGELPPEVTWLAPTINTVLVGMKKWFQDNRPLGM